MSSRSHSAFVCQFQGVPSQHTLFDMFTYVFICLSPFVSKGWAPYVLIHHKALSKCARNWCEDMKEQLVV